jgi:hypothetical protein
MATREDLAALAAAAGKAFRSEMDVVAKLSLAVKKISFLTHMRTTEAGALSRQLANRDIPLHAESIDKRATALTSQSADKELTAAYEELMRVIEALPIASRSKAVAALRDALDPSTQEHGG